MEDVIKGSVEKMVRRHPHVFADEKAENTEEVLKNWARIKKEERAADKSDRRGGYLSGIPEQLPALLRAHKVTAKAARVGFDWKDIEGAFDKVDEEFGEFREAVRKQDGDNVEEEFGDILFTLVNVGRFAEINPEDALRKTIGKFIGRFHFLEDDLRKRGREIASTSPEELEELWRKAKREERK